MSRDMLPNDLLWESGHATELALTTLADGEESLLSKELVDHVYGCDACALKLGDAALVMRGVTNAVQSVKPWLPATLATPVPAKKRAERLPLAAVVVAAFVATGSAVPTLLALPHRIAELFVTFAHAAPAVSHGGVQLFASGLGGAWVTVSCACSALLLVAGFAVVRLLPRPATT